MGGGVPEEFGGAGLDKIATTVLTEKLSIYGGFAVTHGAHAGIGTLPIVYFGTEAQKKKYLPKLATGEWIGAYCLSEPQAGSDAQNALTRAELNKDGTHYILNGQSARSRCSGCRPCSVPRASAHSAHPIPLAVRRGNTRQSTRPSPASANTFSSALPCRSTRSAASRCPRARHASPQTRRKSKAFPSARSSRSCPAPRRRILPVRRRPSGPLRRLFSPIPALARASCSPGPSPAATLPSPQILPPSARSASDRRSNLRE